MPWWILLLTLLPCLAAAVPLVPPGKAQALELTLPEALPEDARLRVVPGGPRVAAERPLPEEIRAWGWDEAGPWVYGRRLHRWQEEGWQRAGRAWPLGDGWWLEGRRLRGVAGRLTLPAQVRRVARDGERLCLWGEDGVLRQVRLGAAPALVGERPWPELRDLGAWADGCLVIDAAGELQVLGGTALTPRDRFRGNGPLRAMVARDGHVHLVDDATGYVLLALTEDGRLRWLGSQNKLGALVAVAAAGDRVLVADARGAVHLLDVARPDTPRVLAALHLGVAVRGLAWHQGEALAVDGHRAYRLDWRVEAPPAISDLGINLGGSRRARLRGDLLYVADWFSGLHIYDVRQPQVPRLVGNLRTPGSTKGVWVEGRYAFIADDDRGLQVADVSDPARPRLVAELPLAGLAYTFDRGPRYLYLAAHRGGIHVLDIDDPLRPRRVGGYDTPGKAWAVRVAGDLAYVADDDHGLLVLDVSDPAAPRPVHALEDLCQAEDLHLHGDLLYVACFDGGLALLELQDPAAPRLLRRLPTPGNARGLAQVGERLYLADWEAGLLVYDLSEPRQPRLLGRYDTRGAAWGVVVDGQVAYALDWWGGIQSIDFADPARPRLLGRYQGRGRIHGLALHGNYALAAAGSGGLQVYDVNNPLNPVWGGGVEVMGEALDVAAWDDLAAVAAGDDGLVVVDVAQPLNPLWLARLDLPHQARRVHLAAGRAWLQGADGLSWVDLRDPRHPRRGRSWLGRYRDLAGDAQRVLWLDDGGGLWVCGVKESTDRCGQRPRLHVPGARRVAVEGRWAALAGRAGLTLVDLERGAVVGRFPWNAPIAGLVLHEGRLFFSSGARVLELDLFDPAHPRLVNDYPSPRPLGRLAVNGEALFAAGDGVLLGGERLPPVPVTRLDAHRLRLQLPATLPLGGYDLLVETEAGSRRLGPLFQVALPPPPKRKKFTLEDLKRIMESGDFPGRAPATGE